MSELLNFLSNNEPQFRKARLGALYSDFRHLRTTNPDGFIANVDAWNKGLADAAREGHIDSRNASRDLCILKVDELLLRALETAEWGRPLALGTVVREAMAKKDMIPIGEFLNAKESVYKKSWNLSPWQIVSWGFRQLGLSGGSSGEDTLPVGKLVVLANLEAAFKGVSQMISDKTSRTDRIFSKELFRQEFGNVLGNNTLSPADLEVFLKFMARDKGAVAYDGQTVKLRNPAEPMLTITPEDSTVASLKTLISDLEKRCEVLSQRIDELNITARNAVAQKNRVSALSALRSRKLAEGNLTKQSATLHQLEEVYSKISQAADQVELVRIMEGSTGVLKSLNAEIGGVERVDAIVDELNEQMVQVGEIGDTISSVGPTIDETEVDDELEEMEKAETQKRGEAERIEKEKREEAERPAREARERQQRSEKEDRERQEAAKTKARLDELEALKPNPLPEQSKFTEDDVMGEQTSKIDEEILQLKRMSLEEGALA